jgi:predicted house-cleaning noncanonical NTP pyrophosphatase (MazG superfamily)
MSDEAKIKIIRGFSWRIIKSKDKWIRRQTIIGLVVNDFLGLMTGDIMELLLNKSVIFYILELISFISEDSYGSKVFFRNGGLYKELVELIPEVIHDKNYDSLAKILQILESLSPNKEMIFELINLNIIDVYVSVLLEDEVVINNEDML